MNDIFAKHNKKKAIKDRLYFYAFYTVLLYLFALMIVLISKDSRICLLDWYCVSSRLHYLQAAFILYLYLLFLVVLLIQTYKLLEKLVVKKNYLTYFKYIFISLPFLISILVWIAGTDKDDAWLLIIFSAILSVGGLLMIELRKK